MIVMIWCFLNHLIVNLRFYGFDALIKELIWIILGCFLSVSGQFTHETVQVR